MNMHYAGLPDCVPVPAWLQSIGHDQLASVGTICRTEVEDQTTGHSAVEETDRLGFH